VINNTTSSSSTNFIATQVLKQNFRAAMCHVLHYSCNVNAAVADRVHCRMICGTVPSSVHATRTTIVLNVQLDDIIRI